MSKQSSSWLAILATVDCLQSSSVATSSTVSSDGLESENATLAPPLGLRWYYPKGISPKGIVPVGIAMLYPTPIYIVPVKTKRSCKNLFCGIFVFLTAELGDKPLWWFHLYIRDDIYCAGHIYTTTFLGESFFLRNNPRIFDFFDGFCFKTVKIIFFLPKNPVLGTVPQKKIVFICVSVV